MSEQKEYIIKEDELRYLVDGFVYQDHTTVININERIRSRPAPVTEDKLLEKVVALRLKLDCSPAIEGCEDDMERYVREEQEAQR